ncbi:glycoside hydrolase family 88/105 protein [Flavobacterium agrisoli]|uniref:Glycoside hydrolase family 88 protein n=1 Tax=Flavobacterium agrisoli TaxID=2793066 RepID=A0A934PM66_9FLAO|nr:glycoside hydrolase family 88 protein [Flavobacterium agrisoli]MBK0370752.1 glycoside hydrolase family 88 protein [Flavobacterium agrisoli]
MLNKVISNLLSVLALCYFLSIELPVYSQNNTKQTEVISEKLKYSERMALSIVKRYPEAWKIDNNDKLKWDYKTGLTLYAFDKLYGKTKNEVYYNYIKNYIDSVIEPSGAILGITKEEHNLDVINTGKVLFNLYKTTGDQKYLNTIHFLAEKLKNHPRTNSGGFWHKDIYPFQMWLDGLYMEAPFYAQYTVEFENGKNLSDVVKQFEEIQKHTYDPKTGLLFHAWDESKKIAWADPVTGRSPNFWSRSIGWYVMALVDVLDYMPKDHPKRVTLIKFLNQAAEGIAKYQDKSGLWFQVTNMGKKKGNYLEASGSCMFSYAFAKGANKGYLPPKYKLIAEKAFDAVVKKLIIVDPDGELHLTQICGSAGLGGNPYRDGSFDYYISEKIKIDNSHGTAPFIMAALELNK